MTTSTAGTQVFTLAGRTIRTPLQPAERVLLAAAHAAGEHPTCRCTPAGVAVYVARLGGQFQIKRMPGTGPDHDPDCPFHQPDGDLPAVPGAGGWAGYRAPSIDPAMPGLLLVLPNLLDDLWQRSRLTCWTPAMDGKRTWRVVSWHLRRAAAGHYFRGGLLDKRLFIPEPFTAAHRREIAARRAAAWAPAAPIDGAHHFMTLLGEVKTLRAERLVVKHLPDAPLRLDDVAAHKVNPRDAETLELWRGDPDGHLIVMATFTTDENGAGRVHELAVAMTDRNWLPYHSAAERALLRTATQAGRRFTTRPPCAVADPDTPALVFTDTLVPAAAYVRPPSRQHRGSGPPMGAWTWPVGRSMPPLPPPAHQNRSESRPRPEPGAEPSGRIA